MSKKLTPALLVAGLIACSPAVVAAAEQRSVDILGMKLGMTPAEIKAALQASDLQFQTREIKHTLKDLPNAPFVGSVHAIRHGADVRSDEIRVDFPPPPHEPRAVLITRLVQYPINAGPLTRDVAAALEDKYGADRWIDDRYANAASLRLAWIDTPAGVRILDKSTKCSKAHWSPRTTEGHAFFNSIQFVDGCGLTIVANFRGGDPGTPAAPMVSGMWTTIVDYASLQQQIAQTQAYVEQQVQGAAKARGTPRL